MNELNLIAEYSKLSDDELLLLASDRASLRAEAAAALDVELRRRNLTPSDQTKYLHFVKRNEQLEVMRRRTRGWEILRDVFGLIWP